jgi:transcriptional regulator with XRE-family HTH domain
MARQAKSTEAIDEDSDDLLKAVAQRLADARKKADLTQAQLGQRIGVKQSYIFELEQGGANATVKTLVRIARALDIDVRDLLPGPPMAMPKASDIQNLVNVLERLLKSIDERVLQERRRAAQEQQFLEEIKLFAELRKLLASGSVTRHIRNGQETST